MHKYNLQESHYILEVIFSPLTHNTNVTHKTSEVVPFWIVFALRLFHCSFWFRMERFRFRCSPLVLWFFTLVWHPLSSGQLLCKGLGGLLGFVHTGAQFRFFLPICNPYLIFFMQCRQCNSDFFLIQSGPLLCVDLNQICIQCVCSMNDHLYTSDQYVKEKLRKTHLG